MAVSSSGHASASPSPAFDTAVFEGLRVVFNFVVVYSHVMFFLPIMLDEPVHPVLYAITTEPVLSVLTSFVLFLLYHSVDVFLFLSGYLFGQSFCSKKNNAASDTTNKSSSSSSSGDSTTDVVVVHSYTLRDVLRHVINRFFRLLPIWTLTWMGLVARGHAPCTHVHVLHELFYIYNLSPNFAREPTISHTCMPVAWSLSTDVQAHVFMALVLVACKTTRRAAFVVTLLVGVTVLVRAQYIIQMGRPLDMGLTVANMVKSREELSSFAVVLGLPVGNVDFDNGLRAYNYRMLDDLKLYAAPYMRASSAMIGFLTWYHVKTGSAVMKRVQRHRSVTLAIVSAVMLFLYAIAMSMPAMKPGPPMWLAVAYESAYRVVFTAAIAAAVMVIGGASDGSSGIVRGLNRVLKNGALKQIAKLSYGIYLMHMFVLWVAAEFWPRITKEEFQVWRFVPSGIAVYVAAVALAVPCHWVERWVEGVRKGRKRTRGEKTA